MDGHCPRTSDGVPDETCAEYPDTPFADQPDMFGFSPDGNRLAMLGSMVNGITVWEVETGAIVATIHDPDKNLMGIEFSPDGAQLLVGSVGDIEAYSTADWSIVMGRDWEGGSGSGPGQSLCYDRQGTLIAAAADPFWGTSDVFVLDPETLDTITVIEQTHDGGVQDLDVSSDGSLIATAGMDGFVRVWEVATATLIAEIPVADDEPANNVQFISDDGELMVTSHSGPITIVTLDDAEQLRIARRAPTRTFTPNECGTYRIDPCPTLDQLRTG